MMSSIEKTGKHTTLYLRLAALAMVALFISASIFGVVATSTAKENVLPYKATTIEECIQEKECVWYHLVLALQAEPVKREFSQNLNVKKWEKPIRVRLTQEYDSVNEQAVEKYLKQVSPFVTQKISANKSYNYLIVVTDNIEKELSGEFHDTFVKIFGRNLPLEAYKKAIKGVNGSSATCHYLHMQYLEHQITIHSYLSFIQKDDPDPKACLREIILAGLGLSDITWSPLLASYRNQDKYSDLELFMLLILYQDSIRSGMTFDQLKLVFDQLYEPALQYVEQTGAFNDNR